jgi:hypothetical protein
VIPLHWFIAVDLNQQLNVGIYEGAELRLVGTNQIPFADLTPERLRSLVDTAIVMKLMLSSAQPLA